MKSGIESKVLMHEGFPFKIIGPCLTLFAISIANSYDSSVAKMRFLFA
jgi:hypothetical protein